MKLFIIMFSFVGLLMSNGFFINHRPVSRSLSKRKSIQIQTYLTNENVYGTEFDLDIPEDEKAGRCDIEEINTSNIIDNNNNGNHTAIANANATVKYYKNLRAYNLLTRLISTLVIERSYIEDEMTTLDLDYELDLDLDLFYRAMI